MNDLLGIRRLLMNFGFVISAAMVLLFGVRADAAGGAASADSAEAWQAAVLQMQSEIAASEPNDEEFAAVVEDFSKIGEREFPVYWDCSLQDAGPDFGPWLRTSTMPTVARDATRKVLAELGAAGRDMTIELDRLANEPSSVEPRHWLELYLRAAGLRREIRLKNLRRQYPQWIFTKHYTLGGSHYAYTEGQSDAQAERHFVPGAALCLLNWNGGAARVQTLLETPTA